MSIRMIFTSVSHVHYIEYSISIIINQTMRRTKAFRYKRRKKKRKKNKPEMPIDGLKVVVIVIVNGRRQQCFHYYFVIVTRLPTRPMWSNHQNKWKYHFISQFEFHSWAWTNNSVDLFLLILSIYKTHRHTHAYIVT